MRLNLIREMIGYFFIGALALYLFTLTTAGSLFSVLFLLSFVTCSLLTVSTFKSLFKTKNLFGKGDVIVPSEDNVEFDSDDELTVLEKSDHEYVCNKGGRTIRIAVGNEKLWKLK